MILQEILFPDNRICQIEEMYFHCSGGTTQIEGNYCSIGSNAVISSDTYFNSFAGGKWGKYTRVSSVYLELKIEGSFQIELIHDALDGDKLIEEVIKSDNKDDFSGIYRIDYPMIKDNGIMGFRLTTKEGKSVKLLSGFYGTEDLSCNSCRIAIDICTFKREKYVERNMKVLEDYIINNSDSPVYDNLYVYISDNGNSLDYNKIESEQIKITPNRNTGGVGGFTRGMLEVTKDKEQKALTHILLMDDDAVINPHSIEKTYRFLQLLKEEYQDYSIGGGIFLLNFPNVQYENCGTWANGYIISHNHVLDMKQTNMVVFAENELPENDTNFSGWWYCCMPLSRIEMDNLPIPVFIHRDDIEFGARGCNGKFITLNGVGVWHDSFYDKMHGVLSYYDTRNNLITSALNSPYFTKELAAKALFHSITRDMMVMRYQYVDMVLRGTEDFLKGFDWFKEQDGVALHKEICAMNYKTVPVEELGFTKEFCDSHTDATKNWQDEKTELDYSPENGEKWKKKMRMIKLKRIIYGLSFNGQFFPSKNEIPVLEPYPAIVKAYRAKKVLNYDLNGKGYICKRSFFKTIHYYFKYLKMRKKILTRYDIVVKEYRDRIGEVTNEEFWWKYLGEK